MRAAVHFSWLVCFSSIYSHPGGIFTYLPEARDRSPSPLYQKWGKYISFCHFWEFHSGFYSFEHFIEVIQFCTCDTKENPSVFTIGTRCGKHACLNRLRDVHGRTCRCSAWVNLESKEIMDHGHACMQLTTCVHMHMPRWNYLFAWCRRRVWVTRAKMIRFLFKSHSCPITVKTAFIRASIFLSAPPALIDDISVHELWKSEPLMNSEMSDKQMANDLIVTHWKLSSCWFVATLKDMNSPQQAS